MSRSNAHVNVAVTFRHTESTDALKNYATEKLAQCIKKYVNRDTEVKVVLSVEKRDHIVEVQVRSKGCNASAKAVTADLYSAIDKVVDNIQAQLRKQKDRIVDRSSAKEAVI